MLFIGLVFILTACGGDDAALPTGEQIPGNCVAGNAYAIISFSGDTEDALFSGESFGDLTPEWFAVGVDYYSQSISLEKANDIGDPIFEEQFFSDFSPPIRTIEQVADLFFLYSTPLDFGGAAFIDARTGQVLFAASIVWMGTGELLIPSDRRDADEGLVIQDSKAPDADDLVFLESEFWRNWTGEEGEGNRVWQLARRTDLIESFSKCGDYKAVIWPYTPTVGLVNTQKARAIVIVTGQSTNSWVLP